MSQEKVDRYKKEKANRKKIMQKEKLQHMALRTAGILACAVLAGWIGYSGYIKWEASQPEKKTEITTDAIADYLNGLNAEG